MSIKSQGESVPGLFWFSRDVHRQTYNIRGTESHNLNVSRLVLQLSLSNPLKPGVKSTMKMKSEQRRHLSDQQYYCPPRYALY